MKQDFIKARKCYKQATDNGYHKAFINLGNIYKKGLGVRQDYSIAADYYQKAAEHGDPKAIKKLKKLQKRIK